MKRKSHHVCGCTSHHQIRRFLNKCRPLIVNPRGSSPLAHVLVKLREWMNGITHPYVNFLSFCIPCRPRIILSYITAARVLPTCRRFAHRNKGRRACYSMVLPYVTRNKFHKDAVIFTCLLRSPELPLTQCDI